MGTKSTHFYTIHQPIFLCFKYTLVDLGVEYFLRVLLRRQDSVMLKRKHRLHDLVHIATALFDFFSSFNSVYVASVGTVGASCLLVLLGD